MYNLFTSSLRDFSFSYKKYLSFELIYALLASLIFVPFLSYIFNRLLMVMGASSLLNTEVYKLGLSFTGMTGILLISFFAVAILFVEFGVLIIIAQKRFFNHSVYVAEAVVTTLSKLPKLLGFGIFQLFFLLLLFIPFIDSSTLPPVLDFNVTIFLTGILYESYLSMIIYFTILILFGYLFIRWIFALHFIFIEDKSIWEAMKSSWTVTKYNKLRLIFYLCLLNLLFFVFVFIVMSLVSQTATLLDVKLIGNFIKNYLLTFSSYLTLIFSQFLIPVNIIILTRLFYQFQQKEDFLVKDTLKLKRNHHLTNLEEGISRYFTKRKYTLTAVVAITLTGMFIINYAVNDSIVYLKWDVAVASHRGDMKEAPENSMSSIRSAIEKGVDAVEVDVMMTKDGVLVLNHDYDLQRTAGVAESIKNMTYEEVSQIDIGRHYDEAFTGERIPTLDEVIQEAKENDTKLILDLKAVDPNTDFAGAIVELVEKHEADSLTYVQSFNYDLLQEIRNKNNTIKIGQILFLSAGNLANLDVDFYTIRESMLTKRFIRNAQNLNREVWVWTVNIERNIEEVLTYNIDGIITDYPERVQQVLGIR
ncbi:glycerophosphodiester phosphodiesterase family protein [Virgibacillus tibetensis]